MFRANFWLVDFGFCWVCGFGLVSSLFSVGFGGLAFGFGLWGFGISVRVVMIVDLGWGFVILGFGCVLV